MNKKINNIIFVFLFMGALSVPLLFTAWQSGGVSVDENRNLADLPEFVTDGKVNSDFTKDFETWFMDHMGFRQNLININKKLQADVFERSLTTSDYKIGKTGDSIYATDEMIRDYAHVNLRSDQTVARIGNSYQIVSDWLNDKDIAFYYVQCVDKHTIYPERFISSIRQIGDVSKTDQVMTYLQEHTTVKAVYFKEPLLKAKQEYAVFSHWGDLRIGLRAVHICRIAI